jgi:uncharacterized protein YkwD
MGVLFLFNRHGDAVKSWFSSVGEYFKNAGDNKMLEDIKNINLIGDLGATTSTSTAPRKKVTSPVVKSNVVEEAQLSVPGIIRYTNLERTRRGLKPLVLESKLTESSLKKVDDMLNRQYFEHISPQGVSVADIVREEGYAFEVVAENLALGNFGTDQKLVQAWMNSPAHRANVLNPRFTEIGVAAANGEYKGERQWLFVQHFGKPLPNCPKTDAVLKNKIDTEKVDLEKEESVLQAMATEIENNSSESRSAGFLEKYNTRVAEYNFRLAILKQNVEKYNSQVVAYNTCLAA